MNPLTSPIKPDQQGKQITNLHDILQYFVDRKIIRISKKDWEKMLADFKGEQRKQAYGKITARLITEFRKQNKLGDGDDVDKTTANAINALINQRGKGVTKTIKGTVSTAKEKPAPAMLIKAFKKSMRSNELTGEAYTDDNGLYEILYQSVEEEKENTGFVIVVFDKDTELTRSDITFSTEDTVLIDIKLPDPGAKRSEYENLIIELESAKDVSPAEWTKEDIKFLVGRTRLPEHNILLLQQAFIIAEKFQVPSPGRIMLTTDKNPRIPVPVFYAWFRQQLPTEPKLLFALPVDQLIQYIITGSKNNLISPLDAKSIEKIKAELSRIASELLLAPAKENEPGIGDVLNTIPEKLPYDSQVLVAAVINDKNNLDIPLLEKLKQAGLEETHITVVVKTLAFQSLAGNFLPLINTLQREPEISSLRDLALKVNKENLTQRIIKDKAHPNDTTPENFADKVYSKLFQAEPTAVLRNMVQDPKATLLEDTTIRANVALFLANLPDTFNIKSTSVLEAFKQDNVFNGIAPEQIEQTKQAVQSLQRVTALSPLPEAIPVLLSRNLTTAFIISEIPRQQFIKEVNTNFGNNGIAIAQQIHEIASEVRLKNDIAIMTIKEAKNGTGIGFIDKGMKNVPAEVEDSYLNQNNLSWNLLFGDADFCECGDCTSVYSAAAYYVDLLQYLRNNNLDNDPTLPDSIKRRSDPRNITNTPLERLFSRRPDLGSLQLTCKNTNTILPYVDLVNEILENYVATKAPINKPLPPSFNVQEETSSELLAQPQHIEFGAYKILKDAVFPFTLPYHQPIDAIRILLKHLESSRHELIDTFRAERNQVNVLLPSMNGGVLSTDPITYNQSPYENSTLDNLYKDFLQRSTDAEYLGLTPEEYAIITKEAFVSREYWDTQYFVGGMHGIHTVEEYQAKIGLQSVGKYYGYATDAEMMSLADLTPGLVDPEKSRDKKLKTGLFLVKNQFLPRTGISYEELVALLKTQYINPKKVPGSIVVVGDSISLTDSCDLDTIRLNLGVPALHLKRYDKIHRFIRLWRKLGWTIEEVDQSITSDITPEYLHQAVAIKKLLEQTGLELSRLLVFWNNINTNGENSLYKRLFLTHNLLAIDNIFKEVNGNYLAQVPKEPLSAHLPVLMAALNLNADDIEAIRSMPGDIMSDELTIENVSKLLRYRLLSKVLGIKVAELIRIQPLFGNVFADPHTTHLFIERWRRIEDAGFNHAQVNYLLRNIDDLKKPMAPTPKNILELAKTLYDGLTAIDEEHQDLKADPKTTDPDAIAAEIRAQATEELVRTKAALYYDKDAVEKIMGFLEGTTVFSAKAPRNIKDQTKPNPPPAGVTPTPPQDYDYLKLENYPLLNNKVKYDPITGSIQVRGILTAAEETAYANARQAAAGNQVQNETPTWSEVLLDIKKKQSKLFNEVFKGIFAAEVANIVSGDTNNIPIDPVTNIDKNTAPNKRARFLELFMPYLRRELARRFIIDTLCNASGLERAQTDILISQILKSGAGPDPIYLLLSGLNYKSILASAPAATLWTGSLIPVLEEAYTFIVKNFMPAGTLTQPKITINGTVLAMEQQTDDPQEWWAYEDIQTVQGDKTYYPLTLKAGKQYDIVIEGIPFSLKDLYWKTNATLPIPVPKVVLLPALAKTNTTTAFTLFKKAALLVNGFELSPDEILFISNHTAYFGGLNFNTLELTGFLRLESYTRLRNSLPSAKINILDFLNWSADPTSNATLLVQKINELTNWSKERVAQLISSQHFNINDISKFRNEENLLKLQKAVNLANKIGLNTDMLFDCAKPVSVFDTCHDNAGRIRKALRSKYMQDDWEKTVKPLNDQLRENQKNALIGFLLVQPEIIDWGVTDADGLFEYFLMDVQMDVCMETSRVKQAIASVQLFIHRCFLNLEAQKSGITAGILDRERWEWMQRYRVWEANRKVFLYPENWIESNLRDDKTQFFKELESELLQKDINKQNVEDAVKAYLHKLDQVADMEVVGIHLEGTLNEVNYEYRWIPGSKLHVISRTRNAPYVFYYRYLSLDEMNWYPWEKIQVDIPSYDIEDNSTHKIIGNGCYMIPYVWNKRLLIFFPQFMKKTKPNSAHKDKPISKLWENKLDENKPIEIWEIKLGWSEYRNGKWTQKQLSKHTIYDDGTPTIVLDPTLQGLKTTADNSAALAARARETNSRDYANYISAWWAYQYSLYIEYFYPTYFANLLVKLANAKTDAERTSIGNAMTPAGHGAYISDAEIKQANAKTNLNSKEAILTASNEALKNANKKSEEDAKAYNDALKNSYQTNIIAYISRFRFVPILSNNNSNDQLLGIKVFNGLVERGIFEFNGSTIDDKTRNYIGSSDPEPTEFHHRKFQYGQGTGTVVVDYINSFQDNVPYPVSDYLKFMDKTLTSYVIYRTYPVNFHHPHTHQLLSRINAGNLNSFFAFYNDSISNINKSEVFGFYDPLDLNQPADVYHELKRPYSIYNWELYFHAPMMLADALSKGRQFEEAMKWYHFVFNPFAEGENDKRFWQFIPFKEMDSQKILQKIFKSLRPNEPNTTINEWRNNPFKPHLVARTRPVAYMKWVVMKYIDNLIAWGDYLFRQDTIESINQATQLYIMAAHILGPRPQVIPRKSKTDPQTYNSLLDKWDAFSNAMTQIETAQPGIYAVAALNTGSNHATPAGNQGGATSVAGTMSSLYFCIPNNPKLIAYWDTISDRLFKIRHCENIDGIFRKLPLFEPTIDPGLLVKAAAQGLSIASVLNDLNTSMPNYRFYYLLQKALELCTELKSLGASMLSALEKKDNESISLLRAKHENVMHNLLMEVKKHQLEEANKILDTLQQNRKSPEHRMKYFLQLIGEDGGKVPAMDNEFSELANTIEVPVDESGLKLIKYEKEDMDKANEAANLQVGIGIVETLAGIFNVIPQLGGFVTPIGVGANVTWGGSNLGSAASAVARGMQTAANKINYDSTSSGKKAGFLRSLQDRVMQANAAGYEIKQIDKQILAQQIRINIANQEIINQQQQIDNAQEIEEFLKNKYTNEELYTWTKDRLSTLYHQVYNIAFDLAKKAEKVYRFERGLTSSNFIQAGYWDAGYNGLLSGEQLYVGLKQLETAYQENRGYDYEITKHVSLRQVSPLAILQLKQTGSCEFILQEVLFDMDYPGHFKRRIKSVSISVPCIAGPYVGLNGTLRLLENKFRNSGIAKNANDYKEKTEATDERFQSFIIPIPAIAASSGQNDSGMFELNFRDERYLPFEGAGAISKWRFELPYYRQFDYDTISDVIIHIRYTSGEGGERLKNCATGSVSNYVATAAELSQEEGLFTLVDLRHDKPNEWNTLKKGAAVDLIVDDSWLPHFTKSAQNKQIESVIFITRNSTALKVDGTSLSFNENEKFQLYFGEAEIDFNTSFTLKVSPDNPDDLVNLKGLMILVKYSFHKDMVTE